MYNPDAMERRDEKFQLIGNRLSAIIAVCLTGFLAAWGLRDIFSGATEKSGWLISLDSFPLPMWVAIALNLCFYAYMLWLGSWACRGTQGSERVVVAGYFTSALLSPIEAVASPHITTAIRSVQAAGMSVAFFAALLILLKSPKLGKGDATTAVRLLLFLGALFVFMFVVGAVLYFTLR